VRRDRSARRIGTIMDNRHKGQSTPEPAALAAVTLLLVCGQLVAAERPAAGPDVAVLDAVEVIGITATKTEQPVFTTPFKVDTIDRGIIDDQQATLFKDVLRNVSGVVPTDDNGGTNDNFTLRGFSLDAFSYRDGVRMDIPQFDPASIERVDVLKGAAANLYGRIEPGGMINVITKKPLDTPYYALEQRIGEYDTWRTEGDATGPLTADGELLYRLVFSYQNNGSFRQFVDNERVFLFPQISWAPTARTRFNLGYEHKYNNDAIDYGIPSVGDRPARLPRDRLLAVPGAESDRHFDLIDFGWSHDFSARWTLSHRFQWYYNHTDYKDSQALGFLIPFQPNRLDLLVSRPFEETYDDYFTELRLTGKLDAFGARHDLMLGLEANRATHDNQLFNINSLQHAPTLQPIDVLDPVYQDIDALPPLDVAGNYSNPSFFKLREEEYWYAVTAQDILHVGERLHVVLSGRYDIKASSRTGTCLVIGTTCAVDLQEVSDNVFSPRVGANYQLLDWLAIFGSYAQSFGNPGAGVLADGSPPGFEEGEQFEGGFKGDWLQGRLSASLAFYNLTKSNVAVPAIQPTIGVVTEVVGEARSRGVEFDLRGALTDRWTAQVALAYTDARVTKDSDVIAGPPAVVTDGRTGLRLANVPEFSASLWTKYALTNSLSLAGGLFTMTEREADADNSVGLPGYARIDLAAIYRTMIGRSALTAQLNVNNLLDKSYFDSQTSVAQAINASPGAPRTILGTIRIEF
jgi:iron complex outermembrane recepter protein